MQTQCPHCQTLFHVTDEQLQAANGEVRCGQCDVVFTAKLISLPEVEVPVLEESNPHEISIDELSIDSLDEIQLDVVDITIPELDDNNELSMAHDSTEQEQEQDDVIEVLNQPSLHLVNTNKKDNEENHRPAELNEIQVNTLAIDTTLQAANERPLTDKTSDEDDTSNEAGDYNDDIPMLLNEENEGYDTSQLYPELEIPLAPASPPQAMPKAYLVASFILILLFVGQSIFLLRDRLAEHGFRPLMQSLCASLACDLALPRAPQDIILKTREIRSHPNIKKALSVVATIDNQARFQQAYPLLQIQFHDIEGRIIAGRDFLPSEYLPDDINIKKGMTPNNPINIALELIDPGKNAVSFLFIFK